MDKCLAGARGMPYRVTTQQVTDKVCLAYQIDSSVLQSKSQQRIASKARAAAGWLVRESGCVTLLEVTMLVNLHLYSFPKVTH
jgi:chromosomal replication initiation ATPase DnaA